MADELFNVRSEFAARVSIALIKELLDDLLKDKIVNDGQSESILQENSTRADKARDLIDTVRKKGDVASRVMITHLHRRDPELYSQLGLGCGQPAPPAAEPQTKQEWSTSLIPTTKEFWEKKQNDRDVYPVTKNNIKSRVALLITNVRFTDERLNRTGAEKDEENMEKLLKALGYDVMKCTNLTGKGIDEALIKFSKQEKLKETDSVLVVIMSHGKLGAVLGVNSKIKICDETPSTPDEFSIDNIYKHLGTDKCPALLNKPKVIIIQACRGGEHGSVLLCDGAKPCDVPQQGPSASAAEEDIEDDSLKFVHKEKDFISLLSCTPDTVSYRHPEHGSILIQYVVDVFNNCSHENDIEELFRKVMRRFEEFSAGSKRQMPTKERCTLTKRFYLFPGV
ncbi:caspase a-like [Seriola aureovittata]|uniref:caspase a-like n=1 Tax=Seriola aureovittata TaxID=2871759 RepID=UPI0024BE5C32|nr:caspase a-like [Seriola aureovittata]